MTFAITNTSVLIRNQRWSVVSGVDVIIEGAHIADCAPGAALKSPGVERMDGHKLLLTPGLVNGHTHSAEVLNRGDATQDHVAGWLSSALPKIDDLSDESIRLAVNLCAVELLRGGVTCVVDHFRQLPARLEAAQAAYEAWGATGMSVVLAAMVRDGVSADGALIDAAHVTCPPSADEVIALCEEWIALPRSNNNVVRAIGPSAPARCSEGFLRAIAHLAASQQAPLHMHVDETKDQSVLAKAIFGRSAMQTLKDAGALGRATSVVHCVHVGQEDIALLSATETTVVHCPVANQRLGSGVAPVRDMIARNVRVTIATDGAASNDSQSLPEAMKAALLLSRTHEPRDRWITPDEVLDMAFQPGQRPHLASYDDMNGHIAPGAPADIAAFDLDDPLLLPASNLPARMVLSGGSLRARFVWSKGALLLKNGIPQAMDFPALTHAASKWSMAEGVRYV